MRARVVPSAMRDLVDRLGASTAEVDNVRKHLNELASMSKHGSAVPFNPARDLLFSDVGRIRIVFKFLRDQLVVIKFGLAE